MKSFRLAMLRRGPAAHLICARLTADRMARRNPIDRIKRRHDTEAPIVIEIEIPTASGRTAFVAGAYRMSSIGRLRVLNLVRNAVESMEQSDRRDLVISTERSNDGMAITRSLIPVRASHQKSPASCSSFSSPRSRKDWASDYRSRAQLSIAQWPNMCGTQSSERHDLWLHASRRDPGTSQRSAEDRGPVLSGLAGS
jgi:hypothetical protein